MHNLSTIARISLLFVLLMACAPRSGAQASSTGPAVPSLDSIQNQADLDTAIAALDAALFDAYNRCDLEKFSTFFVDNVEFYHDQGGVTLGKDKLTQSIKDNICGGDVRRELVPGTLQAHYMKSYGAVEIGVHRFYHPKSNTPPEEGRFIHLWQYKMAAGKLPGRSATTTMPPKRNK